MKHLKKFESIEDFLDKDPIYKENCLLVSDMIRDFSDDFDEIVDWDCGLTSKNSNGDYVLIYSSRNKILPKNVYTSIDSIKYDIFIKRSW